MDDIAMRGSAYFIDSLEVHGEVWVKTSEDARHVVYSDTHKHIKTHVPSTESGLMCKIKPDVNDQGGHR